MQRREGRDAVKAGGAGRRSPSSLKIKTDRRCLDGGYVRLGKIKSVRELYAPSPDVVFVTSLLYVAANCSLRRRISFLATSTARRANCSVRYNPPLLG